MAAQSLNFDDLGGKRVASANGAAGQSPPAAPSSFDFSDLGGKSVQVAQSQQQAAPTATISAVPPPSGLRDSLSRWAENVASDIKYGSDLTGVGTVLKKMGAHGVYSGNPEAVGDFMASLPLGLLRATKGAGEITQGGKTWQGTKDIAGGTLQAATIPAAFVAPEAGEAAASVPGKIAARVVPSVMRQNAGELFSAVAQDANKIPVSLDNAQQSASRLLDWQGKAQLGPTINKFLNRITKPNAAPLTYEEARDYYKLLGRLSADETSKLPPAVMRDLQGMVAGFKLDIGAAAEQVGRGADYFKAMGDYARAARMSDAYQKLITDAAPWLWKGAVGSAGGYGAYRLLRSITGGNQ